MILNLPPHYSECVVACVMIYVNSAESSWSTSWYPFLIGIIVDHYSSSCLADTLFTVNTQSGGENKINCGKASSFWLTLFFLTQNVKAMLLATCWNLHLSEHKTTRTLIFCRHAFILKSCGPDRQRSRRHSLLIFALFPLTGFFFPLLFPRHQPWTLIKCHSHIQSFLQRPKSKEPGVALASHNLHFSVEITSTRDENWKALAPFNT